MTIPNIIFVFLIAVFTGYLTFLTTKGGLTDNRFKGIKKRLTKRGKMVIAVLLILLFILLAQEYNSQKSNNINTLRLKKETSSRDSVITKRVNDGIDSSRKALFNDLSKAFANEQLILDTLKNKIEILRDSIKITTVNQYAGEDPILMIDKDGISPNNPTTRIGGYKLTFKSIDAGSSGFNVICYVLTEDENGYDLSKSNPFPKGLKIPKNSSWSTGYGKSEMPAPKTIHVYMKGSYQNVDGTKSYKVDNLYKYDSRDNRTYHLLNYEREKVMAIIRSVPEDKLILQ